MLSGFGYKSGFRIEKDKEFGKGIALNSDDAIPLISENISSNLLFPDVQFFVGNIVTEGWYNGLNGLFSGWFGYEHKSFPVASGTKYLHLFQISNSLMERIKNLFDERLKSVSSEINTRGTLVFKSDNDLKEYVSSYIYRFHLAVNSKDVRFTWNVFSPYLNGNTVNSSLVLNSDFGERLKLSDLIVTIYPYNYFVIDSGDTFQFFEDGDTENRFFTISSGTYLANELAQKIQNALETTSTQGYLYYVKWLPFEQKFKIWCSGNFKMDGSSLIAKKMGFRTEWTDLNVEHESLPVILEKFDSSVSYLVSELELSGNRQVGKIPKSDRPLVDLIETKDPDVNLSFKTRKNETLNFKYLANDVCFAKVSFVNGDYEFSFFLPYLYLAPYKSPIEGSQIVKEITNFDSKDVKIFDFWNNFDSDLFVNYLVHDDVSNCLGIYKGDLYVGIYIEDLSGYYVSKLEETELKYQFSIGYKPTAIIQYKEYLVVGMSAGYIGYWDGSTFTDTVLSGMGDITGLEVFQGKLYVISKSSKYVYEWDGNTWTQVFASTASNEAHCWALRVYQNKLYLEIHEDFGTAISVSVKSYDGSSWTDEQTLLSDVNVYYGDMIVYKQRLFVSAYSISFKGVYVYDGATWFYIEGTTTKRKMIEYKGKILFFTGGHSSDGRMYVFNPNLESDKRIWDGNISLWDGSVLQVYENKLFISGNNGTLYFVNLDSKLFLKIINDYDDNQF